MHLLKMLKRCCIIGSIDLRRLWANTLGIVRVTQTR
jgi:hypothetical protein